jgi:DNA invertase Pin-like site-specific DNA recombinase
MTYGYCRISTPRQNIERQIRNIKAEYPDALIYKESYTGTKLDRPEWCKLMRKVKPGDRIVFDSVSRMCRCAEDGIALYKELYERDIDLVFLKEALINTEVYRETAKRAVPMTGTDVDVILRGINEYLLLLAEKQITLAFAQAEKEVLDLHQRTKEGIETARRMGKPIGRPAGQTYTTSKEKNSLAIIQRTSKDFNGQNTDAEVIAITGLSRNTYYKYKRRLREKLSQEESPIL